MFFQSLLFRGVTGYFLFILILNFSRNWSNLLASAYFTGRSMKTLSRLDGFNFFGQQISYALSFWSDFSLGFVWLVLAFVILQSNWIKRKVGSFKMQLLLGLIILAVSGAFSLAYGGMVYGLIGAGIFLALVAAIIIVRFLWIKLHFNIIWGIIRLIWQFLRETFLHFA
jgi:hypothetical protein